MATEYSLVTTVSIKFEKVYIQSPIVEVTLAYSPASIYIDEYYHKADQVLHTIKREGEDV